MASFAILTLLVAFCAEPKLADRQSPPQVDAQVEAEVMKLLDEYMSAWNRTDLAAWESTFHFPHYRLASGKMTVLDRPGVQETPKTWSAASDWHHSKWLRRRIVQAADKKVHLDTRFTRYRADGSVIGSYDSLYIVTKEKGRWGVKMRSSFAR